MYPNPSIYESDKIMIVSGVNCFFFESLFTTMTATTVMANRHRFPFLKASLLL